MVDELFEKFDGAFAPNTIRAYRSDFNDFSNWCSLNGLAALECSDKYAAEYVNYLAKYKSPATIRRRIASLTSLFTLLNRSPPFVKPEVILAMKRMHRAKGNAQRQAEPLTKDILDMMLSTCANDNRGMRNKVLLKLGYETMRRRSEICSFKFEDIQTLPNGRAAIKLNFSKTDQFGQGKLISISNSLNQLLITWQERVSNNGYILRGVLKNQSITNELCPASLCRILKQIQYEAKIKLPNDLSGHSFRVGAALDMLNNGESLERIMLKGGWKSESTAIRYLRCWQI